jgi:hypothetical protein
VKWNFTWPGGRIASNLSTPNMPKLDSVNVPANHKINIQVTIVSNNHHKFELMI